MNFTTTHIRSEKVTIDTRNLHDSERQKKAW